MTREEAINILNRDDDSMRKGYFCINDFKAIEVLKSEDSILDKIRAEIESQRKEVSNRNSEDDELQAFYNGLNDGLKDARDILDKYRGEVDETDN